MAGKFLEMPSLVERLGCLVEAIEKDSDERKTLASFVTVAQCLCQEKLPQTLILSLRTDSKPCQYGDGQSPGRQTAGQIGRQVAEVHLCCRQSVVTGYRPSFVEQNFCHRQVLFL